MNYYNYNNNNMIPVGSMGYNNYQYNYNQYPAQMYYQYQQNAYYNNYYNPYGGYNNYYNYNNNRFLSDSNMRMMSKSWSHNTYQSPYVYMNNQQQVLNNRNKMFKLKAKIACKIVGVEYDEAYYDELLNPKSYIETPSPEEVRKSMEWRDIQRIAYFADHQNQVYVHERYVAYTHAQYNANFHNQLDNHSLCEFLEEDYPRLMREFWIRENINPNGSRDLSGTYSSTEYNELLALHANNGNGVPNNNSMWVPTSTYIRKDEDDIEVGLEQIVNKLERYRQNKLKSITLKVPDYIASPEVKKMHHDFFSELAAQVDEREQMKLKKEQQRRARQNE